MIIAELNPKPDITAYELALIVRLSLAGMNHDIHEPVLKFPKEENGQFDVFAKEYSDVMRHFEISEK